MMSSRENMTQNIVYIDLKRRKSIHPVKSCVFNGSNNRIQRDVYPTIISHCWYTYYIRECDCACCSVRFIDDDDGRFRRIPYTWLVVSAKTIWQRTYSRSRGRGSVSSRSPILLFLYRHICQNDLILFINRKLYIGFDIMNTYNRYILFYRHKNVLRYNIKKVLYHKLLSVFGI